jgi:ankyrin repeat protein
MAYNLLMRNTCVNLIKVLLLIFILFSSISCSNDDSKQKTDGLDDLVVVVPNEKATKDLIESCKDLHVKTHEVVDLLEVGADVNARDGNLRTPLHNIIDNLNVNNRVHLETQLSIITALIKYGADVNTHDYEGFTPLMYAAQKDHSPPKLFRLLIEGGADVNASEPRFNIVPILIAPRYIHNLEVFVILINAGANVNASMKSFGLTPLMTASSYTSESSLIELLLQNGATLHAKDDEGKTALHMAAAMNPNEEILIKLLEAGANAKLTDKFSKTAYDWARVTGNLRGTPAIKMLLEYTNE